jgi:hypothetical protein
MFALLGLSKGHPRWSNLFHTDEVLPLSGSDCLAQGVFRQVFDYPGDPKKLIKLVRPRELSAAKEIRLRIDPDRAYRALVAELHVWRKLASSAGSSRAAVPVIHGFVRTDRGVGLACEKIRAPDHSLAPTLKTAIATQDRERILSMLNELASFLLRHEVVARDIRPVNIAHGLDRHDREGLYLIDGTGLWRRLHARRIPAVNRQRLLWEFQKLARRCNFIWDPDNRRFT